MNRRSVFTLSAIAALGVALLPSNIVAQQKTLKQQLIGTWTLVSIDIEGAKDPLYGANPKGTLTFEAGGRFASRFGEPDRPKSKSKGQDFLQEFAAAMMDSFAGGSGTWSVNEIDKTPPRDWRAVYIRLNRNPPSASLEMY
jgi:Lipocalin-like domain